MSRGADSGDRSVARPAGTPLDAERIRGGSAAGVVAGEPGCSAGVARAFSVHLSSAGGYGVGTLGVGGRVHDLSGPPPAAGDPRGADGSARLRLSPADRPLRAFAGAPGHPGSLGEGNDARPYGVSGGGLGSGRGGAIALACGDRVWALENSIYSILSPEGFASILFKDSSKAKEVAEIMGITSYDLLEKGIIEKIIKEPVGGAQNDIDFVANEIKLNLLEEINILKNKNKTELLKERYLRFRKF